MKNLKLLAAAASVLLAVMIYSCRKTDLPPDPVKITKPKTHAPGSLQKTNNRLVFANRDEFLSTMITLSAYSDDDLDDWEDNLDFTSLRRSDSVATDTLDCEILATVMNSNNIFQIGDTVFKIEKPNDLVWYLTPADEDKIQDLIDKQVDNVNVFVVSAETHLLLTDSEDVDSNVYGKKNGIFCQDSWAKADQSLGFATDLATNRRVKFRVNYSQYGVYYMIIARAWLQTLDGSGWGFTDCNTVSGAPTDAFGSNAYTWAARRRCGKTDSDSELHRQLRYPACYYHDYLWQSVRGLNHYTIAYQGVLQRWDSQHNDVSPMVTLYLSH